MRRFMMKSKLHRATVTETNVDSCTGTDTRCIQIINSPIALFTMPANVCKNVPVNFITATLGGKIEVPTLKGNTVIKIPAGTQHDKVMRLKGLGVPNLKGGHTGDQLYVIKVQIPTKLNARQKELLTEFAKESGMVMEADGDGFFDKMKTFFE